MGVRAGLALTRALVTGAGGQDGSYLVELLLDHGYEVTGLVVDRTATLPNLAATAGRIDVVDARIDDVNAIAGVLRAARPREIYHLAAPTSVLASWESPAETASAIVGGITTLLEAVRLVDDSIRICQASTSAVFGDPPESPQRETTRFTPFTPYGAAKAYAHFMVGAYRRRYGMHASCAILYNHESPRRPTSFLPAKVAHAVAAIAAGRERELALGDLEARRDWGYAPDYVDAMWRMLQQDAPDDYVVATGDARSVGELAELAFAHVGLDWRDYVRVDESLKRGAAELHHLVGDASKAREQLGWAPSVTFEELVGLLVDAAGPQTGS